MKVLTVRNICLNFTRCFFATVGILAAAVFALAGCGGEDKNSAGAAAESQSELLRKFMPQAAADGAIKIAVVTNLGSGDFTKQFLRGCVDEGQELGFQVDTFGSEGNSEVCQEILQKVIAGDYDGIVLSHGESAWAYDALLPAVQRGISVVTFDTLPYPQGDPSQPILTGVTATAQEDNYLAEASLMALVDSFAASLRPLRVIYIDGARSAVPLERRERVFRRYIDDGLIRELAAVEVAALTARIRQETAEKLGAVLPRFPIGAVDAIWAPYDEFAKGCLDALLAANRRDIKIFSIDISDDDLRLMLANSDIWMATAAVDPQIIGRGAVRILAAKFAGEPYFSQYVYSAQLIRTARLPSTATITELAALINGWGDSRGIIDDFLWMIAIKRAR